MGDARRAEFLFVPKDQVLPTARRENGKSFDAHGADIEDKRDTCPESAGLLAIALGFLRPTARIAGDQDCRRGGPLPRGPDPRRRRPPAPGAAA